MLIPPLYVTKLIAQMDNSKYLSTNLTVYISGILNNIL